MSEHEKDRHLDELLDSVLSAYSAAEPGPGLESRILANLREAESRKTSRLPSLKWMWTAAAVAAAVLLLVLARVSHHPASIPGDTAAHTQPPAPMQPPVRQRLRVSKNGAVHRPQRQAAIRVEDASLPVNQRPSVFPSPAPLSEQERLLLSYYARTPREELVAQSHPEEPPATDDSDEDIRIPDLVSVPQKSSNTR
jgi:hypothetical protein